MMNFDEFLDRKVTFDKFSLLRKFGNYFWSIRSYINKFWAIPNLGEKISLCIFELKQGRVLSFKQQMTSFAAGEEFSQIKNMIDTDIFPDVEMKRFLNSFIARVDELGDKGTSETQIIKNALSFFKAFLKKKPNFTECMELIISLDGNDTSPAYAKHSDTISLTDPTILSILLYLGYSSLLEGLSLDINNPPGVVACNRQKGPAKPDAFIGGRPIVKMDQ